MMACMGQIKKPSKEELGRIAENKPELLNVLVALFVLEWQAISLTSIPHGEDQVGKTRLVPNYVGLWGVDACIHYLLRAPMKRHNGSPGLITLWLEEISNS